MNLVANFHAYKFTHFSTPNTAKTSSPENLSSLDKLTTLLLGVNNPRPVNKGKPSQNFQTVKLQSNKEIESWYISAAHSDSVKGTVILFHGYSGDKSAMLDKSDAFLALGFHTLVVDFMGSGGSEGNQPLWGQLPY